MEEIFNHVYHPESYNAISRIRGIPVGKIFDEESYSKEVMGHFFFDKSGNLMTHAPSQHTEVSPDYALNHDRGNFGDDKIYIPYHTHPRMPNVAEIRCWWDNGWIDDRTAAYIIVTKEIIDFPSAEDAIALSLRDARMSDDLLTKDMVNFLITENGLFVVRYKQRLNVEDIIWLKNQVKIEYIYNCILYYEEHHAGFQDIEGFKTHAKNQAEKLKTQIQSKNVTWESYRETKIRFV